MHGETGIYSFTMAILQVRNIPEPVYARLKERAAEHRRSVTKEAILLLEGALGFDPSGRDLRNRMIDSLLEAGLSERLWGGVSTRPVSRMGGPPVPREAIGRIRAAREAGE